MGDIGLHLPPDEVATSQEALLLPDYKLFDFFFFHADCTLISLQMHDITFYIALQLNNRGYVYLSLTNRNITLYHQSAV